MNEHSLLMTKLPSAALLVLGLLWLFYAIPLQKAHESAAISDAMQLESDLKAWAETHAGKAAVDELFEDGDALKLGGESNEQDFRGMIRTIVKTNSIPIWPGLIATLLGAATLFKSQPSQF